ncbi:MAG: xanthine dehydrogenase family protein molybdopterin-binding subunit [Ignavibacteriaceae bacterium]|jgi:isoquinoline 1-oxidoreductase beta subunit|nr:xanthine dehydrogenase family protein molybdopterin-binding subunit [Ignavibacteriaceae bacterium]
MSDYNKQTRRKFIKVVGLSGGGLILASFIPFSNILTNAGDDPKIFSPSVFLKIDSDGIVTIVFHRSEMGQGVKTALPMLVAEELEVDWEKIIIEQSDADKKYGNQATGGSTSVRRNWEPLRIAGATAKEMLILAAANKWNTSVSDCYAEKGFVINKSNGEKYSYGELAEDAAKLPVPTDVKLKDPKDYKLIGKRVHRVDTPDKIHGKAIFGIDVVVPGMFYAALSRCPAFGGKVKNFDAADAKSMPGIIDVVKISNGVAVIADSTWHAFKGRDALKIEWDLGPYANVTTEDIRNEMLKHVNNEGTKIENRGNIKTNIDGEIKLDAVYEVPFITHAPMEPMNCVAKYQNGKAEIWAPTQNAQDAQNEVAKALGISQSDVIVHIILMGGGFGRRLVNDYAVEAAEISKACGKTIKLTWTREEDMKFGFFRPPSMSVLKGSVTKDGKPEKFYHHVIAPSISQMRFNKNLTVEKSDIAEGTVNLQYQIPNLKITGTLIPTHVPISWWRAVYNSQNPFAVESFIDEMAYAANKDPYLFRKEMLPSDSRLADVMNVAVEKAGWSNKLPNGKGRGIAISTGYESYCAQIAEVTVKDNKLKIDRYIAVIDCGIVVNPDTVEAQLEGAIVFALSAALKSEITIQKGGVKESNFDDYPMLAYDETPVIETYYIKNTYKVGGVGEVGIAACAPALTNAIFAATGKRIRRLPVKLI